MYKSLSLMLMLIYLLSFTWMGAAISTTVTSYIEPAKTVSPKIKAYNILENKCNVCHRKQNPFMIFSLKNMDKRAKKINKNVFELQRMPKGDEIKLTPDERETLKNWIQSLNIN